MAGCFGGGWVRRGRRGGRPCCCQAAAVQPMGFSPTPPPVQGGADERRLAGPPACPARDTCRGRPASNPEAAPSFTRPWNAPQLSTTWRASMVSGPKPPFMIFSRSCCIDEERRSTSRAEPARAGGKACARPPAAAAQLGTPQARPCCPRLDHGGGAVQPAGAAVPRDVLVPGGDLWGRQGAHKRAGRAGGRPMARWSGRRGLLALAPAPSPPALCCHCFSHG